MTKMTQIGKEYGAALFMLGCETDSKHEYAQALSRACSVIKENPAYLELLSSPNIPLADRLSVIDRAFSPSLPTHVLSFLKLLCEKGRMDCLWEAEQEYKQLLDASERVSCAVIRSAVALTEEQKLRLKNKLEALCKNQVTMAYEIDESLMGGIVVEIDGKIMDGSLRHRLNEVKDVISR